MWTNSWIVGSLACAAFELKLKPALIQGLDQGLNMARHAAKVDSPVPPHWCRSPPPGATGLILPRLTWSVEGPKGLKIGFRKDQ